MPLLKWVLMNKYTGSTIGVIGLAIVCLRNAKKDDNETNSIR